MALKVAQLEEIHSEMCGLLAERQDELARTAPSGEDTAASDLDRLAAEIGNWSDDAAKVETADGKENEAAIADLAEQAKQICWRLSSGYAGGGK
ncbi:hypothetical protein [Leisingera sp. JC11]|uniref:hypothetical protein n=1 Tax=Leisingera sp. JC11 TaxID=3042469 RepID=UPI0034535899